MREATLPFRETSKVTSWPYESPSPGPTLQIAVAAPDIAVMKLSPSADRLAARRTKHIIYKKETHNGV